MAHDTPQNPLPANAAKHCVLLVEDNYFAMDVMRIFLKQQGFAVESAENGQVAVSMYLQSPARYAAIFMDLQMPVMSGYEATERIRQSGCTGAQKLPIVAMSGEPLNNLCERGFTAQLHKPFKLHALLPLLTELLGH